MGDYNWNLSHPSIYIVVANWSNAVCDWQFMGSTFVIVLYGFCVWKKIFAFAPHNRVKAEDYEDCSNYTEI